VLSPIAAILPELGLIVLLALVLVLDLAGRQRVRPYLGWITAAGLVVILILSALLARPGAEPSLVWGGMLRFDGAGFVFRLIFLTGAALTCLFVSENAVLNQRGEFYALLLVSTLGMSLMASAADLIMLYLAIETTSIPLYILAGFLVRDRKSVEAGIKYLLFGAMTSAVMLYGFSLLYGFGGTTQLYSLAERFTSGEISQVAVIGALLLALVGFGFKISAVPFHFWAPDVYEGAPTAVAGFLSTASKAAGFAVLIRVLTVVFAGQAAAGSLVVAVLAVASMIIGNLLALSQKSFKRLLAYSSIAQAGYMLIGVAAGSSFGNSAAIYYLMAYLFTNLAAFALIAVISKQVGSDAIADLRGLNQRAPALSLALAVVMLSLGGIPPFAGFVGKVLVFAAAVEVNLIWLVIVGVINAVISLYYYLTVLRVAYQPAETKPAVTPVTISRAWSVALVVCILGVLVFGTILAPWFGLSSAAASGIPILP
jgi:NADH-quinone oxidoreductase subunit N